MNAPTSRRRLISLKRERRIWSGARFLSTQAGNHIRSFPGELGDIDPQKYRIGVFDKVSLQWRIALRLE